MNCKRCKYCHGMEGTNGELIAIICFHEEAWPEHPGGGRETSFSGKAPDWCPINESLGRIEADMAAARARRVKA